MCFLCLLFITMTRDGDNLAVLDLTGSLYVNVFMY